MFTYNVSDWDGSNADIFGIAPPPLPSVLLRNWA